MITGLSPLTFARMQLNAGVFLREFDYSACADVQALRTALASALEDESKRIGATRGGGTFECIPQMREIEADGKRFDFVGSTVLDGWTVRMTGTLLEIVPQNLALVIGAADVTGETNRRTVRARTDLLARDYIKSLVWVGDTGGGFLLIALQNALSTAGATFTFADRGEGTLPFEFRAHMADVQGTGHAPFEILSFT